MRWIGLLLALVAGAYLLVTTINRQAEQTRLANERSLKSQAGKTIVIQAKDDVEEVARKREEAMKKQIEAAKEGRETP